MRTPRITVAVACLLATLVMSTNVLAQSQPQAGADASPSSVAADKTTQAVESPFGLQLNLDFTNAYFYHGILQQDQGVIIQPAAKLTMNLVKNDDFKLDALLGTWNSFGKNGGTNTGDLTKDWYESDLIAGFVLTKDKLSLTTTYTSLTSP